MDRQEILNSTFRPMLLNLADCAKYPDKYLKNSLDDLIDIVDKYKKFYRVTDKEWDSVIHI